MTNDLLWYAGYFERVLHDGVACHSCMENARAMLKLIEEGLENVEVFAGAYFNISNCNGGTIPAENKMEGERR